MLDEVWSVKVCLLCCPWIVCFPSTGCATGLLVPIRRCFFIFILAWLSHFSDKTLAVLILLATYLFMLSAYFCNTYLHTKNSTVVKKKQTKKTCRSLYYPAEPIPQLLWKCSQAYWCRPNQFVVVLFNKNDQDNCTLRKHCSDFHNSKHCGAWRATLKASLYDKALADQIRRDLQLVPSWLITVHCGKYNYVMNRCVDQRVNLLKII